MTDERRGAARFPAFARAGAAIAAAWRRASPIAARRGAIAARAIGRALSVPAVIGALALLAVTAWELREPIVRDTERVLGDETSRVTAWVATRYAGEIRAVGATIAAIAVALGAALGWIAGGLARLASRAVGAGTMARARLALTTLALVATMEATLVAWSMARDPQLHEAAWWDRGGAWRATQALVTDALGPARVAWIGLGAIAIVALAPAIAARLLRGPSPAPPASSRARAFAAIGAALASLAFLFPRPTPHPPRRATHPNVIVLAADSFRDDRLAPRTAPALDALARRGARFSRAYVTVARTLPSLTTLLTGLDPHHHGVRHSFPREETRERPLDTIATRFARAGYATSVVADYGGDVFRALDLGFADVDAPRLDFRQYIGVRAIERARALLPVLQSHAGRALFAPMRETPKAADPALLADDAIAAIRRAGDRPFFLFVFFSAPHFPYAAPAPYFRRFTDPAYDGRFKYEKAAFFTDPPPDARDQAQIRGLYDGAIAAVDDVSARVLRALDDEGIAQDTIVVVTGDHGEELFDHGRLHGHGDHLLGDAQIRVPLAIVDPRLGPRAVPDLVRDVDVAPTLCDLAGVACPDARDGRSLAPAMRGEAIEARPVFGETELWIAGAKANDPDHVAYPGFAGLAEIDEAHGDAIVMKRELEDVTTFAKHRMAFDGRWKIVYEPTPAGPKHLLFDEASDPGDRADVADREPAELARMKELLWRWMLQDPRMQLRDGFLAPKGDDLDALLSPSRRPR